MAFSKNLDFFLTYRSEVKIWSFLLTTVGSTLVLILYIVHPVWKHPFPHKVKKDNFLHCDLMMKNCIINRVDPPLKKNVLGNQHVFWGLWNFDPHWWPVTISDNPREIILQNVMEEEHFVSIRLGRNFLLDFYI